jgi:transcriptional regulator with XRE-family HTH domain
MTPAEIRELRRRRGWTHKELGEAVFSGERSAIRWEAGLASPRPAVAKRLRGLLDRARERDARDRRAT